MTDRSLTARIVRFPLRARFAIARGAIDAVEVVQVEVRQGEARGRGECRPYARYGESPASVVAAIGSVRDAVERGLDRDGLQRALPPGAARNAVDAALLDLEARSSGRRAWEVLGLPAPREREIAWTLSLDAPAAMAEAARRAADRPVLKLKLGGEGDVARVAAVREAAPRAVLVADPNESWSEARLEEDLHALAALGVAWIEQPLPAGRDAALARIVRPIPVCADESCHDSAAGLEDRYDGVNVKLDKAGGPTAALALARDAAKRGLRVMVGCMVGSSLAAAPATLLLDFAELVDLDGPLWLAEDVAPPLPFEGATVGPPPRALWG